MNAQRMILMHNDAEGSRGGHIIGHTKSGKPVYSEYSADHSAYNKWSSKDHQEASTIHYALTKNMLPGGKNNQGESAYRKRVEFAWGHANKGWS